MEANAALRAIVRRDTGEGYREMLELFDAALLGHRSGAIKRVKGENSMISAADEIFRRHSQRETLKSP